MTETLAGTVDIRRFEVVVTYVVEAMSRQPKEKLVAAIRELLTENPELADRVQQLLSGENHTNSLARYDRKGRQRLERRPVILDGDILPGTFRYKAEDQDRIVPSKKDDSDNELRFRFEEDQQTWS